MFSMVMIFFGRTYEPWSALTKFPILQKLVLINPRAYASEGLRATLVPQFPHLSTMIVLPVLLLIDAAVLAAGLSRFQRKALS